ncbi:hypothetical protein Rs2_38765 [Raphanus sativus]|nr:hypothetical protein Rs2_38765 [Raphanus sativus]
MLLYPRTLEDDLFRWLKVNVNETTEECKLFICPGKRYVDGVFVCGKPSFIITDDMTVQSNSTNVYLQVVRDQGYLDFDKLSESLLVIGSEEVLTLLECLFSSNTPLTDAFLRKQSSRNMKVLIKPLSPAVQEYKNDADSGC